MVRSEIRGASKSIGRAALGLVACAGFVLALGAAALVSSKPASAKPEFAAQTGLPCGRCHENPAGGGKLKAFGEKFKANGNKIK
jgi:hypothetical protein